MTFQHPVYIVTPMKTTIDISDDLFRKGRRLAERENVTFRALVEEGLHYVLMRREKAVPFHWKPVTVKGKGVFPKIPESGWTGIRAEIYKDRGA
jgi:hypothetical protein